MRNPFDATGTIGSMPCERSLGQILAERNDPKLINKIMKLLRVTKLRLKQLEYIPIKERNYFVNLLRKETESVLVAMTGMEVRGTGIQVGKGTVDPLVSHTMCCLHAYFGNTIRGEIKCPGKANQSGPEKSARVSAV